MNSLKNKTSSYLHQIQKLEHCKLMKNIQHNQCNQLSQAYLTKNYEDTQAKWTVSDNFNLNLQLQAVILIKHKVPACFVQFLFEAERASNNIGFQCIDKQKQVVI
ncbi:Hypothetical_protein [Hexamita inflata]|uniref:Hypothetical_protein n=1 Tax=Hexamita inflata TaxID=28002 RepID=A0AA86RD38_9EUKA|nr:Hypothetical protein HINF_LOCUS58582 [Hexamita inflata]